MSGTASTPAADVLFTINEFAEKLSSQMSEVYQHITAKLLYLCKRVRSDLQTVEATVVLSDLLYPKITVSI